MTFEKWLAWVVHLFTASGLLPGFMAILAINERNWRAAMAWLLVALFIDSIDGTLARKFKVKETLPNINGKMIDSVVDFTNYAVIPAYFFFIAGLAGPVWSLPLACLILLVSAIYYGKGDMVSRDFYFIGFPVMWNMVVYYLVFVFSDSPTSFTLNRSSLPACQLPTVDCSLASSLFNAAIIVIFAALHFLPVKFAYPTRAKRNKMLTLTATATIFIVTPAVVWFYPNVPIWLKWLAILNLAYFGVLAVFDTFRSGSVVRER